MAKSRKPRTSRTRPAWTIGDTPPGLAGAASSAFKLDQRMRSRETRPSPQALAKLPWLNQVEAYRVGHHLLTHGLRARFKHPELELCNVPGPFVNEAGRLLNALGGMVKAGSVFRHGEVALLAQDPMVVVGFREIQPHGGGVEHEAPVLRLTFLT